MKIAVLADVLNDHSGARAAIRISEYLARIGDSVTFFATDYLFDPKLKKRLEEEKIAIEIFNFRKPRLIGRLIGSLSMFKKLKQGHFDIISLHSGSITYTVSRFVGVPIIKTYYGTQLDLGGKLRNDFVKFLPFNLLKLIIIIREKVFFLISDKVLSISQYLVREAKELYGKDIDNIYLGFDRVEKKKTTTKKRDTINIFSVSRIIPYKGFHKLIEAFLIVNKKVPNLRLTIAGSSPLPNYLEHLKRIKNRNVRILIDASNDQIERLYSESDIYATYDTWVPWSLTPLEASRYGVALIGLDKGAMSEIIIHNKNGFLATDFNDFVEYLIVLATNRQKRQELGKIAQEIVEKKFFWEETVKEYQKVFEKFLKK